MGLPSTVYRVRCLPTTVRISAASGGTFEGLYNDAKWNNVYFSANNGAVIKVTSPIVGSPDIVDCTKVKGTDQEILDGFGHPTPYTVDFLPSDYWTNNFAADTVVLETLLTNAGYTLEDFAAAEQWPLNDFSFSAKFKYKGHDLTVSSPRLYESEFDADNRFIVFLTTANMNKLHVQVDNTAITYALDPTFSSPIEIGDVIEFEADIHSINGMSITATNITTDETVTDTEPTGTVGVTAWLNFMQIAARTALTAPSNTETDYITVSTLLTPAQSYNNDYNNDYP